MSELRSKCCGARVVPIQTWNYAGTHDMKWHVMVDPQYGCTKCRIYCKVKENRGK